MVTRQQKKNLTSWGLCAREHAYGIPIHPHSAPLYSHINLYDLVTYLLLILARSLWILIYES